MKKLLRVIAASVISLMSVMSIGLSASAVDLPNGSVKGIPEGLYVMDENGNSVSQNGEYYIDISDMQAGETYTKVLSIQNLINTPYTLTMSAEPISSEGNLDLEKYTNIKLYLDGELIYDGRVTGEGNVSMQNSPLILGEVVPGQSKELKAEIMWNGEGLKEIEGQEYLGKVDFKWIFEASIREEPITQANMKSHIASDSSTPNTGFGNTMLIIFAVILFINAVFVGIMTRRGFRKDGSNGNNEK